MIRSAKLPRTLYAAVLLTVLVASLLVGWFVSGWRDVRMRQAEIRQAPRAAADRRAVQLARELRAEFERLMVREVNRPYFHYQNLMHDPQTSAGVSVSRSPLAKRPEDELVLGYFQIDGKGRTTTPTVNDEVPELSDAERLVQNRAFRVQVAHDLAGQLAPAEKPAPAAPKVAEPAMPAPASVASADSSPVGADPRSVLEDGSRAAPASSPPPVTEPEKPAPVPAKKVAVTPPAKPAPQKPVEKAPPPAEPLPPVVEKAIPEKPMVEPQPVVDPPGDPVPKKLD